MGRRAQRNSANPNDEANKLGSKENITGAKSGRQKFEGGSGLKFFPLLLSE